MKRFYYILAALLLLPMTAFAQDAPITVACDEDPDNDVGYFYGDILVESPDDIAGNYVAGGISQGGDEEWGDTTGLLLPGTSGQVVIARDPGDGDDPDEGCTALTNPDEVSGNIALMRRGACAFSTKALNAQAAGAIGFIVYMDERDSETDFQLVNMAATAGEGLLVNIPGLFVSRDLGNAMVSQIEDFENNIVATLRYAQCWIDLAPVANEDSGIVESREISAAYPNPFASRTQFDLTLEEAQEVSVRVYNVLGQEVAVLHDGLLPAGAQQTFTFEAASLPAGVYLYRVVGETFASTRQVTLVR